MTPRVTSSPSTSTRTRGASQLAKVASPTSARSFPRTRCQASLGSAGRGVRQLAHARIPACQDAAAKEAPTLPCHGPPCAAPNQMFRVPPPLTPSFVLALRRGFSPRRAVSLLRASAACHAVMNVGDACFTCRRRLLRRYVRVRLKAGGAADNGYESGTGEKYERHTSGPLLAAGMKGARQSLGVVWGIGATPMPARVWTV